jgi:hypothetical protein
MSLLPLSHIHLPDREPAGLRLASAKFFVATNLQTLTLAFSHSYKTPDKQLLYFDTHTKAPGVYPSSKPSRASPRHVLPGIQSKRKHIEELS